MLCADPHAEGADVVLVEEDGERLPHSAGVDLLVLAVLGEIAVLYDEEGEFQEHLFKADGQLSRAAERRLLRRHLDLDPDAPLARFRLARSLRRAGELRAAASELRQLLRRAPDFAWGQHERGRVSLALGEPVDAGQAFVQASELTADPGLRAYFLAWACLAAATAPVPADSKPVRGRGKSPLDRNALAAQVLALSPEFVRAQEAAVRSALEAEDAAHAEESLHLGLAVVPGHLGLLSLRPAVTELVANAPADQEDEDENDDLDEADVEIKAARAAAAADDDLSDRDDPLEFLSPGTARSPGRAQADQRDRGPGAEQAQAAERGDRAEEARPAEGHRVERAREDEHSGGEQRHRHAMQVDRLAAAVGVLGPDRDGEQRDGVELLIVGAGLPDLEVTGRDAITQPVGAEGSGGDTEEAIEAGEDDPDLCAHGAGSSLGGSGGSAASSSSNQVRKLNSRPSGRRTR